MKKRLFTVYILFIVSAVCLSTSKGFSADVTVTASVDKRVVSLNEGIRLSITINGAQSAQLPQLARISGFNVVHGPATSHSMQIVNGKQSVSVIYTYFLAPKSVGSHTLGPLTIRVSGTEYRTDPIIIKVVKESEKSQDRNIFATIEVSKTNTYINDQFLLTLTLYFRDVDISGVDHPDVNIQGFTVHTAGQPVQERREHDHVVYNTVRFQSILIPQRSGTYTLGPVPITIEIQKRVQSRRRTPFGDDFFSDNLIDDFFGSVTREKKVIQSGICDITVRSVPTKNRPANFSGAVGVYSLDVKATPVEVKEGEPVTVTATLVGRGSIDAVTPHFSTNTTGFRTYDPEITKESAIQKGQLIGEKTLTQVWVPVDTSIQEIPPISFSYFNTEKGAYETITRGPFPIKVTETIHTPNTFRVTEARPADSPTERVRILNQDIFPIIPAHDVRSLQQRAYLSPYLYTTAGAPIILWFLARIFAARRNRMRIDTAFSRKRGAGKNAKKRLCDAQKALKKKEYPRYYSALSDTLCSFIADQLHLPRSHVTPDAIHTLLSDTSVDTETCDSLQSFLNTCDFARFAAHIDDHEKARQDIGRAQKLLYQLGRKLS
jgi:hypothetical protein